MSFKDKLLGKGEGDIEGDDVDDLEVSDEEVGSEEDDDGCPTISLSQGEK